MSYAVKYALLKALGLETGDDPDNESINYSDQDQHTPKPKQASAAHQKRQIEVIKQELIDCRTPNDVKKLLNIWVDTAEKEGWSGDYWEEARRQFSRRKAEIEAAQHNQQEDDFPGSTGTGVYNGAGRELHAHEAG